ncbi:hypothetical protein Hanom_Chr12g01091531 [Helianthus anomalus]
MQTSYDQLLADHHRLISGTFVFTLHMHTLLSLFYLIGHCFSLAKGELERARDRDVDSHNATIDEAKGMLTRCDSEMVELYAQLVHQSPELEKVVADLVNNVNVVGVNGGIKQGFNAARDSVSGYHEGAQDALDAAVKAFDDLHISVLGKVADLVDKPLSVIQQRSKLPIVEEDDNETLV